MDFKMKMIWSVILEILLEEKKEFFSDDKKEVLEFFNQNISSMAVKKNGANSLIIFLIYIPWAILLCAYSVNWSKWAEVGESGVRQFLLE